MDVHWSAVGGWLSAACAVTALAACGGSSNATTSSSAAKTAPAPPAAQPPAAPAALRGVRGRVLAAGELAGLEPAGRRALGINAVSWVSEEGGPASARAAETARLDQLGFVAGVTEHLHPANGTAQEGLSIVEQFRTAAGARAELGFRVGHVGGAGNTAFAVVGIPGAHGFGGSGPEVSGINVAFAKGRYYYLVGAGWPSGTSSPPTRAALIAAALHLYHRVGA